MGRGTGTQKYYALIIVKDRWHLVKLNLFTTFSPGGFVRDKNNRVSWRCQANLACVTIASAGLFLSLFLCRVTAWVLCVSIGWRSRLMCWYRSSVRLCFKVSITLALLDRAGRFASGGVKKKKKHSVPLLIRFVSCSYMRFFFSKYDTCKRDSSVLLHCL